MSKPSIVLTEKVQKIINWFTNNYDNEIGAFGLCELKDGKLVVNQLVFPEQEVTSASVKFGSAKDWSKVYKEVGLENIGKIMFYWHTHPGSASASKTDEEDTFGTLMEGTGRKIFGFLQTAKRFNNIDTEAIIMINEPIVATMEAELSGIEDNGIETECKQIIETKIKKDDPQKLGKLTGKQIQLNEQNFDDQFDFLVTSSSGRFKITAGICAQVFMKDVLEDENLKEIVKNEYSIVDGNIKTYYIQPKKKKFDNLKKFFSKTIKEYNDWIDDSIDNLPDQPDLDGIDKIPRNLKGIEKDGVEQIDAFYRNSFTGD